jgi:acyl-CoA synthetase (AMP-forming)/AMP-acid ligase II
MDFGHWLSAAAGRHPDRIAVEGPGEQVRYRELLLRAVRAAGALHMRGVRRGEPVALMLEPGVPFVEALHGCLLLGVAAVPIDPRLAERERQAVLREIEVRVERPLRGETGVFELPDPPDRDEVALVMHTSGTTGLPKPVGLTFGSIRANARGLAQAMRLGGDER